MILDFSKVKRLEWKEYYTQILLLIIAFILVGQAIDFHFLTHLINGGDTQQWLNFKLFLGKGLFLWEDTATGLLLSMAFWTVPYNFLLFLINIIIPNDILTVNLFWIILLYFLQLSFLVFYRIFVNRPLAILGVLLTIFNIDFFILFHTPTAHNTLAYFAFPLLYYLFHSYLRTNKFLFAFGYVLFQIILFRTVNVLIIANLTVPLLYFVLNRVEIRSFNFYKKTMIVWFLGVLLVSPFLINLSFYYKNLDNEFLQQYNADSLKYQERFNLLNVFRLVPHYSFSDDFPEKPGLYFFDYSQTFLKSPYFTFISFIPLLVLIGLLATTRKTYRGLVLLIFFLGFIFFVKGVNPPLEIINDFLLKNKIFINFFRSGARYFLGFSMPLLILLVIYYLQLNKKKIYFITLLIIYMVSIGSLCLFIYKPIHRYWDTVLPASYTKFTSVLENISGQNKFLVLPIAKHIAGYVDYRDGYSGPDRLYTLSRQPILTKMFTFTISSSYTRYLEAIRGNYRLLNDFPNTLGYNYLILEKDAINTPDHEIETYQKIQKVINYNLWEKIYENEDFILYKFNEGLFNGLIYSDKSKVMFKKNNNVEYDIGIDLVGRDTLHFQNTFDHGWKLYLDPVSAESWCKPATYYTRTGATECEEESNYVLQGLISNLLNKPIFSGRYSKKNELTNQWNIDPEYIKNNYSSKYYIENPDGSVRIRMTLYYRPQLYFNFGLLVSLVTALSCLGYTLSKIRKDRAVIIKDESQK